MRFYFGNGKLLSNYYMLMSAISVSLIALAFLSVLVSPFFSSALFVLGIITTILTIGLIRRKNLTYIEIENSEIEISNLFLLSKKRFKFEDIALIVKNESTITIELKNNRFHKIRIEYLDAEDVKKLLLYLKFQPSISTNGQTFL